jgi:hypothetical protein
MMASMFSQAKSEQTISLRMPDRFFENGQNGLFSIFHRPIGIYNFAVGLTDSGPDTPRENLLRIVNR